MATNGNKNYEYNQCPALCNVVRCWKWDVSSLITQQLQSQAKYAVIILNRPIVQNPELITSLWNNATLRVTVDGGTTRWDTFLQELSDTIQKEMKLPDLITGDFDSVQQCLLQKYKDKCCKVICTPDQNNTDFTKALMELNKWCKLNNLEVENVVTICQNSGRLDQVLANIQTLFLAKERMLLKPSVKLYLMTDGALSWLLQPGDHIINIPEETLQHKKAWCSLVPVGEACASITTTGLKWNLNDQPLMFGAIVSTSNTFDGADVVTVKCTNAVLWSMKIPSIQIHKR